MSEKCGSFYFFCKIVNISCNSKTQRENLLFLWQQCPVKIHSFVPHCCRQPWGVRNSFTNSMPIRAHASVPLKFLTNYLTLLPAGSISLLLPRSSLWDSSLGPFLYSSSHEVCSPVAHFTCEGLFRRPGHSGAPVSFRCQGALEIKDHNCYHLYLHQARRIVSEIIIKRSSSVSL